MLLILSEHVVLGPDAGALGVMTNPRAYAGFHPFGTPSADDLQLLREALTEAGRDPAQIEMVGGTRATFPDDDSCADLGAAMAPIAEQIEQGFTTFCVKPSQFMDSADELPAFLREAMHRAEAFVA